MARKVVELLNGGFAVDEGHGSFIAVFKTHAEAWAWIDKHDAEHLAAVDRQRRIAKAFHE